MEGAPQRNVLQMYFSAKTGIINKTYRDVLNSGIPCQKEVSESYDDVRKNKYRYITYKIRPNVQTISIDKWGARDASFADLKRDLPLNEPRFFIYDAEYTSYECLPRKGILFAYWVPAQWSTLQTKILYASSKSTVAAALHALMDRRMDWEITDPDDLTEENLISRIAVRGDLQISSDPDRKNDVIPTTNVIVPKKEAVGSNNAIYVAKSPVEKSHVVQPDVAQPEVTQSDVAQPAVVQPDVAQPDEEKLDVEQ